MKTNKIVIHGIGKLPTPEEAWERIGRRYCGGVDRKEVSVRNSAESFNRDEMKYPDDYYTVLRLMEQYGDNAKLSLILTSFRPLGFRCPQCDGTGKVRERYATDSLAVATGCADWSYRDAECPLCKGTGAVPKRLKPKMVQDGWQEA